MKVKEQCTQKILYNSLAHIDQKEKILLDIAPKIVNWPIEKIDIYYSTATKDASKAPCFHNFITFRRDIMMVKTVI